jgi:hypothetical protein
LPLTSSSSKTPKLRVEYPLPAATQPSSIGNTPPTTHRRARHSASGTITNAPCLRKKDFGSE